jgi:hypothetical protein
MNIMQEVACKLLVSAIDEAMANINHQFVIIAPQRPDRRPEKCLTRSRPVTYCISVDPMKSGTDAARTAGTREKASCFQMVS